jgi:hypothetical protein
LDDFLVTIGAYLSTLDLKKPTSFSDNSSEDKQALA